MTRSALYAGSFDPVTNGHVDIVRSACRIFDRLVIAVGTHPGKTPFFSADERVELLKSVVKSMLTAEKCALDVVTYAGLTVDAAHAAGATVLVRGLRDAADLEDEMRMAGMNQQLAANLQTVFIPASPAVRPITATLVRQIAALGGDVSAFVPALVADRLAAKFKSGR